MTIDSALFINSASGDRLAQYQFYKQCYSLLMGICVRYTRQRDDAVALLNQGFLKILLQADKYKPEVPLEAWLRRVMINTAIDQFRQSKQYEQQTLLTDFSEQSQFQENSGSDWNAAYGTIETESLEEMLLSLAPMTARVFNLFAIDGFSHKEIADLLHISEGTSKWHVNQSRTQLKTMIQQLI